LATLAQFLYSITNLLSAQLPESRRLNIFMEILDLK
jgi:hypothetical protein